MKKYTIIEHTTDIRLHLEATTLEELFSVAIEGMAEIITPGITQKPCTHQNSLRVESFDTTTLLIDFMSEVLTQTHIDNVVYYKVTFKKLADDELEATVSGIQVDRFQKDIKAVTYHEADVKKNERSNFETTIVFDV